MRRLLLLLAKAAGVLAGIICTLIAAALAYASIDRTDEFFVVRGALAAPDYLSSLEASPDHEASKREKFGVMAHRIANGSGMVFAYRFYTNGSPLVIDDEGYEKATVWLPNQNSSLPAEIQLNDSRSVMAIYSRGGSAWPRAGCSGHIRDGFVRVKPRGLRVHVEISGVLHPQGNFRIAQCEAKKIHLEFEAKEIAVSDLTPWLGRPGPYPYAETYR